MAKLVEINKTMFHQRESDHAKEVFLLVQPSHCDLTGHIAYCVREVVLRCPVYFNHIANQV